MKISLSNFPMVGDGLDARAIVDLARVADRAGVDRLCIADFPFHEECTSLITAALVSTERLEVESLVTSPFHRSPEVTALTWATISNLSQGRVILGIGRGGGGTWSSGWGWDRPDGILAVEELIDICQTMWAGERPLTDYKLLNTSGRPALFTPQWKIPILVAARGPKMLALAARRADIVHLALPLLDDDFMKHNVDLVRRTADEAGRDLNELEIDLTVGISIAEDRDVARESAKALAAVGILWSTDTPDKVNKERKASGEARSKVHKVAVAPELIEALSTRWNTWADDPMPADISDALTDEIIDQFVVFGTAKECGVRLREITDRLPGVTGLRLKVPRLLFGDDNYGHYAQTAALFGQLHEYFDR